MKRDTLSGQVDRFPLGGAGPSMGKKLQPVTPGRPCKYIATAPATCGAACDVPLTWHSDVLLPFQAHGIKLPVKADTTRTPGAKRSTPGPQSENVGRLPFQSTAPTVR